MAINNGWYVVTGGYMDPNGNIVEEKQWVPTNVPSVVTGQYAPSTNSNTFSPAEAFSLQSQGYGNLGDKTMSAVYGDLANSLGKYSTYANTTLGAYDNLLNFMAGNENRLQNVAGNLYNELVGDINTQRNYVYDMFGPEGTLTKEVNTYYDDLGNYLATDAGRQAAKIAAQGVHSGASLGAIRAQQNAAYNESFGRYVQAKEQQINAKQQIASNLINFMSTLRKEYGDTTNQYIIELYKRANDLYNNVALSVAQDLDSYNKLRFASSGSGGSSSANDLLNSLIQLQNAQDTTSTSSGGGVIKSQGGSTSAATEQLGKRLNTSNSSNNSSTGFWPIRGQVYDKKQKKWVNKTNTKNFVGDGKVNYSNPFAGLFS